MDRADRAGKERGGHFTKGLGGSAGVVLLKVGSYIRIMWGLVKTQVPMPNPLSTSPPLSGLDYISQPPLRLDYIISQPPLQLGILVSLEYEWK